MLMRAGLRDRDAGVVRAATQLLCTAWVKKAGYNLIELARMLGVEHFPEDAERVLRHALRHAPAQCATHTPRPPFALHQLCAETALYWRVLADHTRATASSSTSARNVAAADEAIEALMCDTVALCDMLASPRVDPSATPAAAQAAHAASLAAAPPVAAAVENATNTGNAPKTPSVGAVPVVLSASTALFVRTELLKLSAHADVQDELGAARFAAWLRAELCNIESPADQVAPALAALKRVHTRHAASEQGATGGNGAVDEAAELDFVRLCCELLADVRDPLDAGANEDDETRARRAAAEQRADELQTLVDRLHADKNAALQEEDYERAAAAKRRIAAAVAELDTLEDALGGLAPNDERTWHRLASVAGELLAITRLSLRAAPPLVALRPTYVLPALQHEAPAVRAVAVRALGMYALLGRAAARENLILLMQPLIHGDAPVIQLAALKGVADCLLLYGLELARPAAPAAQVDASGSATAAVAASALSPADVLRSLVAFMQDEDVELRTAACESLAKLLYIGRLADPGTLSALIVAYFNPATADDAQARQCLALFFPALLAISPAHRALFGVALMRAVRTFAAAPAGRCVVESASCVQRLTRTSHVLVVTTNRRVGF